MGSNLSMSAPRSADSLRTIWYEIRFDLLAFAGVLAVFGWYFYLHWDLWEDQSSQVYMAWGMFHGLRPYVDLVDPNWPGSLLLHTVAYLISGVHGWGLRLIDLFFLYALSVASSFVLAAWGAPLAARLVGGMSYLTYYMATDWRFTAQRESFCWPLFVISAIPFLVAMGPTGTNSNLRKLRFTSRGWLLSGILAGLSLSIRPSPVMAIVTTAALTLILTTHVERPELLRCALIYFLGITIVAVVAMGLLAASGAFHGFIKWGISYDLGPYLKIKMPWRQRLHIVWFLETSREFRAIAFPLCGVGAMVAFCCPRIKRNWLRPARPLLAALILFLSGLTTALLQGKLGSIYHLIPMNWSLAFLAATLWSVIQLPNWLKTMGVLAAAMIFLITLYCSAKSRGPTLGSLAANQIAPYLKPDDQIVEWGYAPSLLLQLQHRTPLAPFVATAFLVTSPPDAWPYPEILGQLNIALQNPTVKYLIIDRYRNDKIQPSIPHYPRDFIVNDANLTKTIRDQYVELANTGITGFDVLEHRPVTPQTLGLPRPISAQVPKPSHTP